METTKVFRLRDMNSGEYMGWVGERLDSKSSNVDRAWFVNAVSASGWLIDTLQSTDRFSECVNWCYVEEDR